MINEADTSKTNIKEHARELLHLKLSAVVPSNTNPRLNLDKEPFEELRKSIEQNGLLQPIVVRPIGDAYEIIGGHRRFTAISQLAKEHPGDKRFARIAAVIRDVEDRLVPVLQLAENLNRSDLSPIEVAEGIGAALESGVTPERLAEQLGWTRRNLNRYLQLHEAPPWLKAMAREVKSTRKKVDAAGKVVVDAKTEKPVLETERHPGLPFTFMLELIVLYNLLHDNDCLQLEELGGDAFKPQAERVVRRLAVAAAVEGWTTAKLRAEVKRAKDPKPRGAAERDEARRTPLAVSDRRLGLDMGQAADFSAEELGALAVQLTQALKNLGFKRTVVSL